MTTLFPDALLGACALLVLLALPGWLWLGRCGLTPRLLLAPAAGLCLFPPLALVASMLFGLSVPLLCALWVLLAGTPLLLRARKNEERCLTPFLAAALLALLPAAHVMPVRHDGGLFVAPAMYDHSKVAMIDAMRRDGIPPVNPFYGGGGKDLPLNYYLGGHALAAIVGTLTGISSWAADVALTWFAALALFTLAAAFALRWGGGRAAFIALLVCFAGSPSFPLRAAFGPHLERLVTQPVFDGMGPLLPQVMYAHQHALAAAVLLLLVRLLALATEESAPRTPLLLLGAGAFAFAGATSSWICIAFALSSPLLLWALRGHLQAAVRFVLPALLLGALLALLPLRSMLEGPGEAGSLVALHIQRASELSTRPLWNVPLYWVQYLPLEFGVAFVFGLAALWRWRGELQARLLLALSLGVLLVSQFVRSAIFNNDLGWRAPLLALPALCGAAAALGGRLRGTRWRGLWIAGLTIGLLAGFHALDLPAPRRRPPETSEMEWRRRFARQKEAWRIVREHAGPEERVQCNPYAFAEATRWPANLGWSLFADRRTVIADPHPALTFSWRQDRKAMIATLERVARAFTAPEQDDALYLRDFLRVRVLLLGRDDGAWPGEAFLEAYDLVHDDPDFRVFLARGR